MHNEVSSKNLTAFIETSKEIARPIGRHSLYAHTAKFFKDFLLL